MCYHLNFNNRIMSKKQNLSILSPENYIRQRARNLPIYKCFINESWRRDSLAHITIARKHINNNITFCAYLVDLQCLGVKDTYYRFNALEDEFYEFHEQASAGFNVIEADYNLVHNIIHAGWEFGESIGFAPHKDFLSVTQYMLDEDTDDIPIIDVHCGDADGKPFFIQGPLESDMEADRIVRELRKNVGEGNFNFVLDGEDDSFEDAYDEDHDDLYCDIRSEYEENSYDENVRAFLELSNIVEYGGSGFEGTDVSDDQLIRLEALSDIICEELVDDDEVDAWMSLWYKDSLISFEASRDMIGISQDETFSEEDIEFVNGSKDPQSLESYIQARWGDVPFLHYLHLKKIEDPDTKNKQIAETLLQYPDYGLLKIEKSLLQVSVDPSGFVPDDFLCKAFFGDREEITPIEYTQLQFLRAIYLLNTNNYSGIEALYLYNGHDLEDLDRYDDIKSFNFFLLGARVSKLKDYLLSIESEG